MLILGPLKLVLKILAVLVAAVVVYFAVTLVQVWLTSREYDPQQAQAIVVMGAAQYNGVPSPDLRARLDEALQLYHQGYAHLIAVTGNKEPGDQFTEAQAGAQYLQSNGVPPGDIVEAGGDDSWANLADVAPLLKARDATTVLMVTDPFHEDRSMAIATDVGLTPYPTPTQTSPITGWSTLPYFLKEAVGVGLGRVVGYDHLHALG
ncbi:MAG TPA: YdcF family protein [Acidimicrobiales bacterium]|nr:YdcF family protein [Acidimicrobiales bacterium]